MKWLLPLAPLLMSVGICTIVRDYQIAYRCRWGKILFVLCDTHRATTKEWRRSLRGRDALFLCDDCAPRETGPGIAFQVPFAHSWQKVSRADHNIGFTAHVQLKDHTFYEIRVTVMFEVIRAYRTLRNNNLEEHLGGIAAAALQQAALESMECTQEFLEPRVRELLVNDESAVGVRCTVFRVNSAKPYAEHIQAQALNTIATSLTQS